VDDHTVNNGNKCHWCLEHAALEHVAADGRIGVSAQGLQQQPQCGQPHGEQQQQVSLPRGRRIAADGTALYAVPCLPHAWKMLLMEACLILGLGML
jgi:hypothetical protein